LGCSSYGGWKMCRSWAREHKESRKERGRKRGTGYARCSRRPLGDHCSHTIRVPSFPHSLYSWDHMLYYHTLVIMSTPPGNRTFLNTIIRLFRNDDKAVVGSTVQRNPRLRHVLSPPCLSGRTGALAPRTNTSPTHLPV